MKVGVLVVAYNAETTLARVLDRIPDATQLRLAEVLVHDDHSTDDTHGVDMAGDVSALASVTPTFDYDNNVQGGRTPGTDADVTVIGLGPATGQYVRATATIGRSTTNSVSLVAALERNYSNP